MSALKLAWGEAWLLSDIEADPICAITCVKQKVPGLRWQGFERSHRPSDPWAFMIDRAAMTSVDCVEQFVRAAQWLDLAPRRKGLNFTVSSYGWKHCAEHWQQRRRPIEQYKNCYIGNGMFLAAAFAMGLRVRECRYHINGFLNISAKAAEML